MAHRIFQLKQVSGLSKISVLNLWRTERANRSADEISFGLAQLVLDTLKTTCTDANANDDFTLPANIDATTLNDFVTGITNNLHFDANQQEEHDAKWLARFIEMCVQHSKNADWMQTMLCDCLCILCQYNATASLVIKTMVGFYFQVIIKRYELNNRTPFAHELEHIRERFYVFVMDLPDTSNVAINRILSEFFKQLNAHPECIQYDAQGMGEIIGKFFMVKMLNVKVKLMLQLLTFANKHPEERGNDLFRLCANQPAIKDGLASMIFDVHSERAQQLAFKLANKMQRVIPGRLFSDKFYASGLFCDDQTLRDQLVELYRLSFRKRNTDDDDDEPDTKAILLHAMDLYRDYRVDYTCCAQRLTNALFQEFTDWDVIFALIEENIVDTVFNQRIFHLLNVVYKALKRAKTADELAESEELLRAHAKSVIQCLTRIDCQAVPVDNVDQLICSLLHTDKELKLVGINDCQTLAAIIIAMSEEINMTRMYAAQINMMLVMKCLLRKRYIGDEILQARITACFAERADQQQQLQQTGTNFDENRTILYTAMKLNVLTELQLIDEECAMRRICIECDEILMKNSLEMLDNHTFLGYTILTLVRTHIFAFKKAGNRPHLPDTSVSSPSKIADHLLNILANKRDDIDFLIQSIIWGLTMLELYFLAITEKKALNAITDCVLRKVNLIVVGSPAQGNVDLVQLKYVEYMLVQIHILLKAKRSMQVCELIVALYTKFPKFHLAVDLMQYTAEAQLFPMLTDAILDILKQLRQTADKKKFVDNIISILRSMPNISRIQAEIRTAGLYLDVTNDHHSVNDS